MAKAKKKPTTSHPKKICNQCERELSILNFYVSNSVMFKSDGRVPICKECVKKMVDVTSIRSVKEVLKILDRPFIESVWENAINSEWETFGAYLKDVSSLQQYKNLGYEDSASYAQKMADKEEAAFKAADVKHYRPPAELVTKWGKEYSFEEITKLESFWNDMMMTYEIEGASHKDYLKKICKVSLKMEESIDDGRIEEFKKLSDVYDKLMHSSKFTAVQRSSVDKSGGMNSFSEFFDWVEKAGFVPKFHTGEPMDIVDATEMNLKEYTRNLVLGDTSIATIVNHMLEKGLDDEEEFENNEITIDMRDELDGDVN
jgi:hypothetical protein